MLVYHIGEINVRDLPKIHSNQMNVFFNQKAPYHGTQYKSVPPNFFNITMTYRSDSDVIIPYDKLELIDKTTKEDEIWTWKEVGKRNRKFELVGKVFRFKKKCIRSQNWCCSLFRIAILNQKEKFIPQN
jgi:hypothetical protein